ncbi:hypothetical protein ACFQ08_12475 [Streptosporangium algeriense]|uniref:Uncharacterized protein n=1 Tax=Streptosporangium algeriense TaxID=1682748 RepID=A0ABW3DNC3_9ACTN
MTAENPPNENMIAALLRERAAYVAASNADRVAQVDEQLAYYGHTEAVEVPKGRTAGGKQTADASGTSGESAAADGSASGQAENAADSRPLQRAARRGRRE